MDITYHKCKNHLKLITMKNLKKISRKELKSISGGIEVCIQNCMVGYYKCCIPPQRYYCTPNGSQCGSIIIEP